MSYSLIKEQYVSKVIINWLDLGIDSSYVIMY
jgi:hypothetical protein